LATTYIDLLNAAWQISVIPRPEGSQFVAFMDATVRFLTCSE